MPAPSLSQATQELYAALRAYLEAHGLRPPAFIPDALRIDFLDSRKGPLCLPLPDPPPTARPK